MMLSLAAAPAQAATGGGCAYGGTPPAGGGYIGSACISWHSTPKLVADFYVQTSPGCNFQNALLTIYINGSPGQNRSFTVTGVGRYGDVVQFGATAGYSKNARSRVQYWDCNWNYKGDVWSPYVYY